MRAEQKKAFFIGAATALICSVLVSASVVLLAPFQQASRNKERTETIVLAAGFDKSQAEEILLRLKPVMVDMQSGSYKEAGDTESWYRDYNQMLRDPARTEPLSKENDIALIKSVPDEMLAYVMYDGDKPVLAVLPVYGAGLWSTMKAYLGVNLDNFTVSGIRFYEHGETPGLGGEIDNPRWQAQWKGKALYKQSKPSIYIFRNASAAGGIDALSGSTLTTDGVRNMINFWMGEFGYKHFLEKIREDAE